MKEGKPRGYFIKELEIISAASGKRPFLTIPPSRVRGSDFPIYFSKRALGRVIFYYPRVLPGPGVKTRGAYI